MRGLIARMTTIEGLNFLLTNRIPRRLATRAVGWLSHIEKPWVAKPAMAIWRIFSDVDLSDAATDDFPSMHACFTRSLRPGARTFEGGAGVLSSPSDAILGAHGMIAGDEAHQIKGAPYRLSELLGDECEAAALDGGRYATLRLTAGMYHRFHAPQDLVVEQVRYLSGDCWNVNTPVLKRVERLFCRNERAVIRCRLPDGSALILVAVAAVLVASIRLTFLDTPTLLRDGGERTIPLHVAIDRGAEMGWFEHGSTIIVLTDTQWRVFADDGSRLKAGEPLMTLARE